MGLDSDQGPTTKYGVWRVADGDRASRALRLVVVVVEGGIGEQGGGRRIIDDGQGSSITSHSQR